MEWVDVNVVCIVKLSLKTSEKRRVLMWRTDLIKNKLYSIGLILIGIVPILIEGDATALVFFLMIGVPLFFAKENWIT